MYNSLAESTEINSFVQIMIFRDNETKLYLALSIIINVTNIVRTGSAMKAKIKAIKADYS